MVSIPKIVGVVSCGFVLCLSLSNAVLAVDRMESDPCDMNKKGYKPGLMDCGLDNRSGADTIKGEVARIDRDTYIIKQYDGKESSLHIDQTTQKTGNIKQGDRIEAKVNEQNHALSIRQEKQ